MSETSETREPLEDVDGSETVTVECVIGSEGIESCDGWEETIELESAARYEEGQIYLPGFGWECEECGNPQEFLVDGIRVSNLV